MVGGGKIVVPEGIGLTFGTSCDLHGRYTQPTQDFFPPDFGNVGIARGGSLSGAEPSVPLSLCICGFPLEGLPPQGL